MSTFEFPALFSFPPLFTLQPVDATRAKQLEQWKQIVIGWHQAKKQTTLVLREWPHWENTEIKSALAGCAAGYCCCIHAPPFCVPRHFRKASG